MAAAVDTEIAKREDQGKPSKPFKSCLKHFLEYTTAHGCGRIAASSGIFWKVFWITCCIGAHVSFWIHFYVILGDYMNKPIRTRVSMQRKEALDFPVVTICNRNMLRQSKIPEQMAKTINEIRNSTSTAFWKNKMHANGKDKQQADSELLHFMQTRLESVRHIVSQYKPATLREIGHQMQDMMLDCIFDGEDCRERDSNIRWKHIWIEDIGNCYMFNRVLQGESRKPHRSMLSGDKYGLRLLLNLEQYEYLDGMSPYAGLKVVIGSQGEMPFPLSQGINVGPGLSTSIEMVMKESLRMDPFNNNSCDSSGKLDPTNIYHEYNMTYSKMACRLSCLSNMQIKRCGCSQFRFTGDRNIDYCVMTNETVDHCIDLIKDDFLNGACNKQCPPSCSDITFSRTVSTYKWPANRFKDELLESVRNMAYISLNTTEEIRDNLLELHIYYADMDYELVEETLKYGFEDLISNIGGQMGMWIGLSALTVAEVIELIWILIRSLLHKQTSAVPTNNGVQQSLTLNNLST